MADSLEPTPDGQMSILFQNTTKYGRFECELWCKEARAVCEHIICNINSLRGAKASAVHSKLYISFPMPPMGASSDQQQVLKRKLTLGIAPRRGLLLYDTTHNALVIALGPGVDVERCVVFGRLVGHGLHQLHLFDEALVRDGCVSVYDIVIDRCLVTECPFEVPLFTATAPLECATVEPAAVVRAKNTKVLSFVSDDDDCGVRVKSCHDVLEDPRLSRESVVLVPTVHVAGVAGVAGNPGIEKVTERQAITESILDISPEITAPEPTKEPDDAVQRSSVVQERIQSFLKCKPKTSMGKRRADQVDTLSALNSFCAKLRQAPPESAPTASASAKEVAVCRLHGLVGCGSCTATYGLCKDDTFDKEDGGWMRHALRE